jgi:dihydroorotate dehydrogenase (fumarate)
MIRLKTDIAKVDFEHCIFNAAGPYCVTFKELQALGDSNSSGITMKSCTIEEREGNPEPRYKDLPLGSINSMGLPNLGYKRYCEFVPILKSQYSKPLIASVSGLKLQDNIEIIRAFNQTPVDLIELNLSCPNIPGKPQMGYDFEQTDQVLSEVMPLTKIPIGVKLPPYFDFVHFKQAASILNKHKVRFVSCINSVGNTLVIDPEKEQAVIKPKGGFGGLGGQYIKPVALANVRRFYQLLDKDIDIIGVGGIGKGVDVFEFILAGAKAVQIATVFAQEKHSCFERIEREFNEIMERKGYTYIEEARGKLKEYSSLPEL